jgi:plastocyanin
VLTEAPVSKNLAFAVVLVAVAALGLLLWGSRPGAAADIPKPVTHTVTMEATAFQPAILTVKAGDSVVWVNKDPFPHTATSGTGGFDSDVILPEKSWTYTPTTKGEFAYICTLHLTMKGVLRVE